MSPDEVIGKIKATYGLSVSRSTLLNYEKNGSIPVPERKSHGRGMGSSTEYPNNTPELFFKQWCKIRGLKL